MLSLSIHVRLDRLDPTAFGDPKPKPASDSNVRVRTVDKQNNQEVDDDV